MAFMSTKRCGRREGARASARRCWGRAGLDSDSESMREEPDLGVSKEVGEEKKSMRKKEINEKSELR
jgi:hypothetical protein